MRSLMAACLGVLVFAGTAVAQEGAVPALPDPIDGVAAPVAETSVVLDEARGMAGRAQSLARLAPELKVAHRAVTPAQCVNRVKAALNGTAYQVFVVSSTQVAVLAPLLFDVGMRSRPNEARLPAVCQDAQSVVVTEFSEKVRRSKDPAVQRDYVVALTLADWAQTQLDGTGLVGRTLPADVNADPFDVLAKLPAATK